MDPDEDDFVPDFMRFVNKELAFSSYVSINIEQGVVDSVQVHKTTWSFLLMLLGTIAMLNRFARMPLVQIIPVLGFLAVSCTIAMHVAIRYTRQKVSKLARDEPAAARGEAMEPSSASPAARFVRTLQGRNPASLCMLRTLQITLLLISYLLSRVLLDVHDWAVTAKASRGNPPSNVDLVCVARGRPIFRSGWALVRDRALSRSQRRGNRKVGSPPPPWRGSVFGREA